MRTDRLGLYTSPIFAALALLIHCFLLSGSSDNLPRYAQIVWMKSTACRWWPCELIHPRNAPMNLSQLKHAPSEFLVHYIGSTDYGWVSRSQTIPYKSGLNSLLNNPIGNASVNRDRMFNRGIRLAKVFYDVYVSILLRRGLPINSVKESPLTDEELAEQITSECAAVLGILDQSEAEAKALKQAKERFENIYENIIVSEQLKKVSLLIIIYLIDLNLISFCS